MSQSETSKVENGDAQLAVLLQKGMELQQAGMTDEAQMLYREILKVRPEDVNTLHLLGTTHMQKEQHQDAIDVFEKAIEIDDKNAALYKNLGLSYMNINRPGKGENALRHAIDLKPDDPLLYYNLGLLFEKTGRADEALLAYKKCTDIQQIPEAYNNTGLILLRRGSHEEAKKIFEHALDIKQDNPNALSNLGLAYHNLEEPEEALKYAMAAVYLAPEDPQYKITLSKIISRNNLNTFNPDIKNILTLCLGDPRVRWEEFSNFWMRSLTLDPLHKDWTALFSIDDPNKFKKQYEALNDFKFLDDDFLITGLKTITVTSPKLEKLLTHVRRYYLEKIAREKEAKPPQNAAAFIFSLAEQCFYTEYVYYEEQEEKELLASLEKVIKNANFSPEEASLTLAIYACYRPLCDLENAAAILEGISQSENELLRELAERQIRQPLAEKEIAQTIESITDQHADSDKYHEIYDAHPYPRWKSTNVTLPPDEAYNDDAFNEKDATVLIAGCGTGQHSAQVALTHPFTKILAIDFSRSTLAYAIRMSEEFGIKNIEYKQADIMKLDKLDQQFNYVDCAGVIHHIDDWQRAFKILAGLVKPGGKMSIGVYSATARENVKDILEFTGALNVEPDANGIREARRAISRTDKPEVSYMARGKDFYSMNSRYHIFPMDEHWFTIEDLKKVVEITGMSFMGFKLKTPEAGPKYREMFPDDERMTNLDNWEKFEQENRRTFTGMYTFILHKPRK